jgi:hypothetical protein
MLASEPLVYLRLKGRGYVLLGDADLERGRHQATHCRVLSLSHYLRGTEGADAPQPASLASAIHRLASEKRARRLLVPSGFPLGLARELRRLKIRVKPRRGEFFFPEREIKSASEVEMIRASLVMGEVGMAEAIHALRNGKITPGRVTYRGSPLTSKLRSIVRSRCSRRARPARDCCRRPSGRCAPDRARAASRHQPHPPRHRRPVSKTGYRRDHADRGAWPCQRCRAGDECRRVLRQESMISWCAKAPGFRHSQAIRSQLAAGFRRGRGHGSCAGCSGHGPGHRARRRNRPASPPPAVPSSVRTCLSVGAGLYCLETGGHADLLVVTRNGARNLTQFERVLEV